MKKHQQAPNCFLHLKLSFATSVVFSWTKKMLKGQNKTQICRKHAFIIYKASTQALTYQDVRCIQSHTYMPRHMHARTHSLTHRGGETYMCGRCAEANCWTPLFCRRFHFLTCLAFFLDFGIFLPATERESCNLQSTLYTTCTWKQTVCNVHS